MEAELVGAVKDLATAIAHNNGVPWQTIVAVSVMVVVGALGAAGGAYWRRRGENLATKADFAELQAQLKANTRATEEIKSQIGFDDWRAREANALRRGKIEEIHALLDKHSSKVHLWAIHNEAIEDLSQQNYELLVAKRRLRMKNIARLYLPSLRSACDRFVYACDELVRNGPSPTYVGLESEQEIRARYYNQKDAFLDASLNLERQLISEMNMLIDGKASNVAKTTNSD